MTYKIRLNPGSDIYKAHFPEKPITPGVCIVQVIVEILSDYMKQNLLLSYVKNVKFLQLVSPETVSIINIGFKKIVYSEEDTISFQAVVFDDNTVFTKAYLQCKI